MKICILEDDKAQAERMAQYLDRYHREHADFSYELERYARAFDLLEDYRGDADLLFLDIRLPDQLGIETARRIREKDARVMIVFVTNLAQYAIEGYSVQAFDYILKPVDYFAFRSSWNGRCGRCPPGRTARCWTSKLGKAFCGASRRAASSISRCRPTMSFSTPAPRSSASGAPFPVTRNCCRGLTLPGAVPAAWST